MAIVVCEVCGKRFQGGDERMEMVHEKAHSIYHVFFGLSTEQKQEVLGLGSQVYSLAGVLGSPIELNGPIGTADEMWGQGNSYGCDKCGKLLKGSALIYEAYDEKFIESEGTAKLCKACFLPEDASIRKLSWAAIQRLLEISNQEIH